MLRQISRGACQDIPGRSDAQHRSFFSEARKKLCIVCGGDAMVDAIRPKSVESLSHRLRVAPFPGVYRGLQAQPARAQVGARKWKSRFGGFVASHSEAED